MYKKILLFIFVISTFFAGNIFATNRVPPSYENNFSNYLLDSSDGGDYGEESVYDLKIDRNKTLAHNIQCLLYPNSYNIWCSETSSGVLWDLIRYLGFVLLFIFILIVGFNLLINWDDPEKVKKSLKSLYYMAIWALLLFAGSWLIWTALNVNNLWWTWMNGTWNGLFDQLAVWWDSLFLKTLLFLKWFAFFVALIMVIFYWFRMMYATDKADKTKQMLSGVWNALLALVFTKIIDYIYYIAQLSDFGAKATELIIQIAKVLWYILWWSLLIMIFYAWYLLLTDQWKAENMKKAKNIIMGIVLSAVVLFFLMLILYQIFSEFA